jgi:hypothetical protein
MPQEAPVNAARHDVRTRVREAILGRLRRLARHCGLVLVSENDLLLVLDGFGREVPEFAELHAYARLSDEVWT